jgi:hypothetical protein
MRPQSFTPVAVRVDRFDRASWVRWSAAAQEAAGVARVLSESTN